MATEPAVLPSSIHVKELDGLRGLAIMLVLIHHSLILLDIMQWPLWVQQAVIAISETGRYGVDLFFILSGYLISGILIDSRGKIGYFSSFVGRRVLRIFPLYFATITFLLVGSLIALDQSANLRTELTYYLPYYLLFAQNIHFALHGWPEAMILPHLWSLAVEEQFYLIWPLVIAIVAPRRLLGLCAAMIVTALVLRLGLSFYLSESTSVRLQYVLAPTRMDTLACGAAIAILVRAPVGLEPLYRLARVVIWPAIMLLMVIFALLHTPTIDSKAIFYAIHLSLVAVIGTCLLVMALRSPEDGLFRRLMRQPTMLLFGKLSYSIYLIHPITWLLLQQFLQPIIGREIPQTSLMSSALSMFIGVPLQLGLSYLIWHLFEKQCLKLKHFFPRPTDRPTAEQTADIERSPPA